MAPQNKLVLFSSLCLLVLLMSVNGTLAEPKHVGDKCTMAPYKCPDFPGACSLNPGKLCPHPEYLRCHADVDGHGRADASLFSLVSRYYDRAVFNSTVQGETTYFLNADGKCTNLEFLPIYRTVLPPVNKEDTVLLGMECTVDHDAETGHLFKNTLQCKNFAHEKPMTAREQ